MIGGTVLLALTAGMVGAVNPCGFSLLPAYVGFFVAGDDGGAELDRRILRAVGSAGAVTVGFVLVFVTLGLVLESFTQAIQPKLPIVTIAVGAALVLAGLAAIAGRQVPLPRFALRAIKGRGPVAMVSFGAVYALASLSCTIGPFLAITAGALHLSFYEGLLSYGAYAIGMGVVIVAIAFGAATVRPGPAGRLRALSRYAPRLGGVIMVIAGAYAVWYGRWELAVYHGDLAGNGVIDVGERIRMSIVGWLESVGAINLIVIVTGLVITTVFIARAWPTGEQASSEADERGIDPLS
jgi:cytochrome c-type biogenesis protein